MAKIRVEVTEGNGGWTPVPDGTYDWLITEVKQGNAASGTGSIGTVCEVERGPSQGKKATFWFYLTKKAGFRLRKLLEATGTPFVAAEKTEEGENLEFDTDDLLNRSFTAVVKIEEYEGKLSNKLVKFVNEPSSSGAKAAPPAQPATSAPKAAAAPPRGAPPPRR